MKKNENLKNRKSLYNHEQFIFFLFIYKLYFQLTLPMNNLCAVYVDKLMFML